MRSQLTLPLLMIAAGFLLLLVWAGQRSAAEGEAGEPPPPVEEAAGESPAAAAPEPEPQLVVATPDPEPVRPEPVVAAPREAEPEPASEPIQAPLAVAEPEAQPEPEARVMAPGEPATDGASARELVRAIKDWVGAWSEQRVDDYLDCYSRSFVPEEGIGRAAWAAQRRERIAAPRFLRVAITGLETRMTDAGTARATFLQYYRSDGFSDTVRKTLELVWEDGRWRIQRESSERTP